MNLIVECMKEGGCGRQTCNIYATPKDDAWKNLLVCPWLRIRRE